MRATILALTSLLFVPGFIPAVQAKIEKQVTRTIWEIKDFPGLERAALAVCSSAAESGSKLVLSPKAKAVCETHQWPSITKAGLFRNSGVGAELNTLMRQAHNPPAPGETSEQDKQ